MAVTRAAVATVTTFLCAEPVLPPAVCNALLPAACKALLPAAECAGPGCIQIPLKSFTFISSYKFKIKDALKYIRTPKVSENR